MEQINIRAHDEDYKIFNEFRCEYRKEKRLVPELFHDIMVAFKEKKDAEKKGSLL